MKLVLPKTSKVYDIKENRRGDKLLTIIIDPFLGRNTSLDLTGKSIGYGIYYSVKGYLQNSPIKFGLGGYN